MGEDTLGRYRLGRELGRGGMGVVYEANDPELDRRVAVKVLHGHDDRRRLARMAREAQAVAALSHPNVVQIFDVGLAHDPAYIVMELLPGATLREWFDDRPEWRAVVRAYLQAARGLAAAHEVGIVHRDFKPGNAMIDRSTGSVKVLDFGLARPEADSASRVTSDASVPLSADTLTMTGAAMGTPSYMAPEQHRGERVDARADVYGLAAALYEALYRRLPFEGRTADHLLVQKERGVAIERPDPLVPASIHDAIRRALAPDVDARWPSMAAFIAALTPVERRRATTWVLGTLAVVGLAAAAFVDDPTARAAPKSGAAWIDPGLAAEGSRLVVDARLHEIEGNPARALGTAMGAVTIAAASGSPRLLARAEIAVGTELSETFRPALALPWLERGIDRAHELAADDIAVLGTIRTVSAFGRLRRTDEALDAARQARALADRMGDDGVLLVEILATEAAAMPPGDPLELEKQEAVVALLRSRPDLAEPHVLAMAVHNLGAILTNSDTPRARALLLEALEIRREEFGPFHTETLGTLVNLAWIDYMMDDDQSCIDRAGTVYEHTPPNEFELRAVAGDAMASCLWRRGEIDRGLEWIDRALEAQAAIDPEDEGYASKLETKAQLLSTRGDATEADVEALLLRSLIIREQAAKGPSHLVASTRYMLAWAVFAAEALDRAEAHARRTVAEYEAVGEREHLADARILLARILVADGRTAEALAVVGTELDGTNPAIAAAAKGTYARALAATDESRARELGREALAALTTSGEHAEVRDELRAWLEERHP